MTPVGSRDYVLCLCNLLTIAHMVGCGSVVVMCACVGALAAHVMVLVANEQDLLERKSAG